MSSLQQLVGTVVGGRYRIEKLLGEGGMGAVFEATQISLSRRVAVKVLKPAFEHDEERIKRFEVETEAIARLQHPHIVHVVDAGRGDDGVLFLAMELLEGQTVREALRAGPFHWPRALTVAEGIASALVAAHAAGVIHRDLKGENVLLWERAGRPDYAKVLDFGVAKLTSRVEAPAVTGSGFVAGTPGSISPEQILGKNDDPRSDLYSVGVLLFEMIAGRPPFLANNPMELMLLHLNAPVPSVAEAARGLGRSIPAAVDALVTGLLQKDPALRPPNALALVDALRSMRESMAATAPDFATPVSSPISPPPPGGTTPIGSKLFALPTEPLPVSAHAPAALQAGMQVTSPTTAMPTPPDDVRRLRRRRGARVAVGALVAFVLGSALMMARDEFLSRTWSTQREAREHLERAVEAYWNLDARGVNDATELALAADPEAAYAHVLRAQVISLEDGALSRIDAEMAAATAAAQRRSAQVITRSISENEDMIQILAELDTKTALRRFEEHNRRFRCNSALERQMLATKIDGAYGGSDLLEGLYHAVPKQGEPMRIATATGLAAAARMRGDIEGARALLKAQQAVSKSAVVVDRRVDVEQSVGDFGQARHFLEEARGRDRGDWRAQLRLAILDARTGAPTAFDSFLASAHLLRDEDPVRMEMVATAGEQLAALGRMAEADKLWSEAFQIASKDNPDRAVELASVVMFFAMLSDDAPLIQKWYGLTNTWLVRAANENTTARTKVFALAGGLLMDRKSDPAALARDVATLRSSRRDIPLVLAEVEFFRALRARQPEQAEAAAGQMPHCIGTIRRGLTQRLRAELATNPADAVALRRKADEIFATATSESQVWRCTAGLNVLTMLQTIALGTAYAERAKNAFMLGDRTLAQAAVSGFGGQFPNADPTLFNMRTISEVQKWLDGAPRESVSLPTPL